MRRVSLALLPFVWWVLATAAWVVYVVVEIRIGLSEQPGPQAVRIDFDADSLLTPIWLALGLAFFVLWRVARRRALSERRSGQVQTPRSH
jgi:hypothetical protein